MSMQMEGQLELPFPPKRVSRSNVLEFVEFQGFHGATVAEVRDFFGMHHGRASSALSLLHRDGTVVRLAAKRDRCAVYVTPGNEDNRGTRARGRAVRLPDGYDDALTSMGYQQGRTATKMEVLGFATRLREAMRIDNGNQAKAHTPFCYKQHPECALLAVMKFIRNDLGE